jgi:hypothetical protein
MSENKLPWDFSANALDNGVGMNFHPVTGVDRVANSFGCGVGFVRFNGFDPETCRFYIYEGYDMYTYLPRIGDGKPRSTGDPYPEHWRFDPFTGIPFFPDY